MTTKDEAIKQALASEAKEQPAQQEPVNWADYEPDGVHHTKQISQYAIDRIIGRLQVELPDWLDSDVMTKFARAIEAAHGIKENT